MRCIVLLLHVHLLKCLQDKQYRQDCCRLPCALHGQLQHACACNFTTAKRLQPLGLWRVIVAAGCICVRACSAYSMR